MKTIFENQNTATHLYPLEKQQVLEYAGYQHKKMGKSYQNLTYSQRIAPALKLIGLLFLSLTALGIPLTTSSWRKKISLLTKEIKGQEKVLHYVSQVQDLWFSSIQSKMQLNLHTIKQGVLFIKIGYEHGEIKKQILIKNENEDIVTQELFNQHLQKLKQHVNTLITNELGYYKHFDWLLLVETSDARICEIDANHGVMKREDYFAMKRESSTAGSGISWGKTALTLTESKIKDLGFASLKNYIENKKFVKGDFYQDLSHL